MNKNKVGLVVGSFVGLLHLVWSLLIAFSFAQALMDFSAKMHSVNNPFTVAPFDFMLSLILIIIAFCVGYIFGYVFAMIWNKLHQ